MWTADGSVRRLNHRSLLLVVAVSLLLLIVPAMSAQAAFPGSNGKIVYVDNDAETLFLIQADGSGVTELTTGGILTHRFPTWSADGTKIAFTGGFSKLEVVNADGSGRTVVTRIPERFAIIEDSAWSPNGKSLAFCADKGFKASSPSHIFVVHLDGTHLRDLTKGRGYSDCNPSWSPDRTKIAFSARTKGSRSLIAIMNRDGSSRRILVHGFNGSPDWSPDSAKIVFMRNGIGGDFNRYDICVVNRNGTGLTNLTRTVRAEYDPAFSPDGTKIVYEKERQDPPVFGDEDLWKMNANGSSQTSITDTPSVDEVEPDWQPI